jgi:hypothetical protein
MLYKEIITIVRVIRNHKCSMWTKLGFHMLKEMVCNYYALKGYMQFAVGNYACVSER